MDRLANGIQDFRNIDIEAADNSQVSRTPQIEMLQSNLALDFRIVKTRDHIIACQTMALGLLQFPQTQQKLLGNARWPLIAQIQSQQIDAFGRSDMLLHLGFGFGTAFCALFAMLCELRTRLVVPNRLELGSMKGNHATFLCPLLQMSFVQLSLDIALCLPEISNGQTVIAFLLTVCLQLAQQILGDSSWQRRRRLIQIGEEVRDFEMRRLPLFVQRLNRQSVQGSNDIGVLKLGDLPLVG